MKNLFVKTMVGFFVLSMMTLAFSANSNAAKRVTFGGGPAGSSILDSTAGKKKSERIPA